MRKYYYESEPELITGSLGTLIVPQFSILPRSTRMDARVHMFGYLDSKDVDDLLKDMFEGHPPKMMKQVEDLLNVYDTDEKSVEYTAIMNHIYYDRKDDRFEVGCCVYFSFEYDKGEIQHRTSLIYLDRSEFTLVFECKTPDIQ